MTGWTSGSCWPKMNSLWHRLSIRRHARQDAQRNIPAPESGVRCLFEDHLLELGRQHLDQAQERFLKKMHALQTQLNDLALQLRKAVERYEHAREARADKQRQLGRDVRIHVSRPWYVIVLGLIVLGEFALNYQAFQVFQKPLAHTAVMALTIAVGLPASAHFVGLWLRQWPPEHALTVVLMVLSFGLGVACLVGVNVARTQLLDQLGAGLGARESALQSAFLAINVFVYSVAILGAYFAHDPDADFERSHRLTLRSDRLCERLVRRVARAMGRRDRLVHQLENHLDQIESITRNLVNLYRQENLRRRQDALQPPQFLKEVPSPRRDREPTHWTELKLQDVDELIDLWAKTREAAPLLAAVSA